jgi:hypothetical protein
VHQVLQIIPGAKTVMNHHKNHIPDYQEFIKYEGKIEMLLKHNAHKYRYVGEEGKEYEVIQSVFNEINHLPGLSNKHIRWYAIIINLRMSFENWRRTAKSSEGFPGFPLPEFPGDFRYSLLGPTGADGSKIMTQVGKGKAKDLHPMLMVPAYMGLIDSYVNEIARLGMLVCTKEEINPGYLEYKLERIDSLLAGLLEEMDSEKQEEAWEEVFILTIRNAADNAIKLGKLLMAHRKRTLSVVNTGEYRQLIIKRIQRIDETRLAKYNNMDAFWNGFIP